MPLLHLLSGADIQRNERCSFFVVVLPCSKYETVGCESFPKDSLSSMRKLQQISVILIFQLFQMNKT